MFHNSFFLMFYWWKYFSHKDFTFSFLSSIFILSLKNKNQTTKRRSVKWCCQWVVKELFYCRTTTCWHVSEWKIEKYVQWRRGEGRLLPIAIYNQWKYVWPYSVPVIEKERATVKYCLHCSWKALQLFKTIGLIDCMKKGYLVTFESKAQDKCLGLQFSFTDIYRLDSHIQKMYPFRFLDFTSTWMDEIKNILSS